MNNYSNSVQKFLITGATSFGGSNLLEKLPRSGHDVIGIDNFATGFQRNLGEVSALVSGEQQLARFRFIEGDDRDLSACRDACDGIDCLMHQAALSSVPRSIKDPINTNANNIDDFLNMLVSARDAGTKHFVYATSSSTYSVYPHLSKVEQDS